MSIVSLTATMYFMYHVEKQINVFKKILDFPPLKSDETKFTRLEIFTFDEDYFTCKK